MNEVQERLISDFVEVEGFEGQFQFRAPTLYENLSILRRQRELIGDFLEAGPIAANFGYMLASLEFGIHKAPDGFVLADIVAPTDLDQLYNAYEAWRSSFQGRISAKQGGVGRKGN